MTSPSPRMRLYASFEEWRTDQSAENLRLIDVLVRVIETEAPHLDRTVKWGQACWQDDVSPRVYIHAADDHVQLGFYSGAVLDDPLGQLRGSGKFVRHVRVASLDDIDHGALRPLILQAVTA